MQTTHDQAVTTPQLGRYAIDPGRSAVTFRTRHLFGLAPVRGTFAVRSGTVDVAEPVTASRVQVEIDAASFRTRNRQRDSAVRSASLLDAAAHPVITFAAGRLDGPALTGTLTVRGVTRPITLTVEQVERDEVAAGAFTARATARIDRTDFGVTALRGLAGRYLGITVEVQCTRS
jgi:polyisoprenoid-binding protein YceI